MSNAPEMVTAVSGAGLLSDDHEPAGPHPVASATKRRASKGIESSDRVLPASGGPTDVEIARAEGTLAAAALTHARGLIGTALADLFSEEDETLYACEDERGEEAIRKLTLAEAGQEERDRCVAARLKPLVLDAASAGCAIEEMLFWERERDRVHRLYEAMAAQVTKREARVAKILWPLIKEYCAGVPREGRLKSWKFPTTKALVTERTDRQGRLEVEDDEKVSSALLRLVGPEIFDRCVAVRSKVYVEATRDLLAAKKIDPATVAGVKWTPPGTSTLGLTRRS